MASKCRRSALAIIASVLSLSGAASAWGQVRISQAYGAGGLNAGQPNADYVELYNAGDFPQDLSGWSVQVSSTTLGNVLTAGWNWQMVPLSGTIQPHSHFLIQMFAPASGTGSALPTPDLIATNTDDRWMEPTGCLVALVTYPFAYPAFFCPVGIDPSVQDFVAWGDAFPNCGEGGAVGPATRGFAPYQAIHRLGAGCRDTDSNPTDLVAGSPTPRNSASAPAEQAYLTSPVLSAATLNAGTSTMISVTLESCAGTALPTLTSITADLSAFGLSASTPLAGGSGAWSYTLNVPVSQAAGAYSIVITGVSGAATYQTSATVTVLNPVPVNDVCGSATSISAGSLPYVVNLNVSGATNDLPLPGTCVPTSQTTGLYGVWYTFVAPSDGTLLWQRGAGSSLNFLTGIWVNEGCGSITQGSAICATGNDWGVVLHAGDTALIQVSLKQASTPPAAPLSGTFSFVTTAPSNDLCPNVADISGQLDTPVFLTNIYGQSDPINNDLSHANCNPAASPPGPLLLGTQGAWYKFVSTQAGALSANNTPGTIGYGTDVKWAVWARPTAESAATACAAIAASSTPDDCTPYGSLNVATDPGMTYYVLAYNSNNISGYLGVTQVGPISLTFHFEPGATPANDACVNAMDLSAATLAPLTVTVGNSRATMTGEEFIPNLSSLGCAPASSEYLSGVWFKYVAIQDGVWRVRRNSTQNNTVVVWEVPTGTPAPCASFNVNNIMFCSRASGFLSTPVRVGKTYYMYVYRNTSLGLASPIRMENTFIPASQVPANDTCDGAVDVASILGSPHVVDTYNASHDVPHGCSVFDRAMYGIWYKYTPAQDCIVTVQEDSLQDVGIALWDGGTSPPPDCNAMVVDPFAASNKIQQVGLGTGMYCSSNDDLPFRAFAGHTYYLLFNTMTSNGYPPYPLRTTFRTIPLTANENCAAALTLSGAGPFYLHNVVRYVSTTDNDIQTPDPAFASLSCPTTVNSILNDTWYRWVAPADGPVSFQTRQYPRPMSGGRIAIYNADAGGGCPAGATGSLIKCLPLGTSYPDSGAVTLNATAGQVFYLQYCSTNGPSSAVFGWSLLDIAQRATNAGRCCVGAACVVASAFDCAARAGIYGGNGSTCATATATVRTYAGAGGAIPDSGGVANSAGQLISPVTVPDAFTVADVEVDMVVAHPKYGDLRIELAHGSTVVVLADRGRRGFSPADATTKTLVGPAAYRLSESGTQSWFDLGNVPTPSSIPAGVYRPYVAAGLTPNMRAAFNGQSAAGVWTLRVYDDASGNAGTLTGWSLRLTQGTAASCTPPGVCCRGATCNAAVAQASCTTSGVRAGASFSTAGATCGASAASPCCFADYNKLNGQSVQDIFDYLNDWFAGSPFALVGGNGNAGALSVQNIFDFLNAWFAGCS